MANDLMKLKKNEFVDKIGKDVKRELMQSAVQMPIGYSFENALKSAYLMLLETKTKDKKPVLDACSPESIHNSILDMAVQGLNPMKKQCSFIAYGSKLQLQREWAGSVAVAKRVHPEIDDINAQPIYNGDKVSISIENGVKKIKPYEQDFMALAKSDIIGAYAVAIDKDGNQIFTDMMTMDEIKSSWRQSKMNPVSESGKVRPDSTHGKFTEEMVRKTVYHRLCKKIINTSDDSALLNVVEKTDEERDEAEIINEHIRENANKKLIDFPAPEPVEESLQVEPEGPAMATEDQIEELFSIEKANKRADGVLTNVSGFFGREIKGLKELTKSEAAEFIDMQREEQKTAAGPDWK